MRETSIMPVKLVRDHVEESLPTPDEQTELALHARELKRQANGPTHRFLWRVAPYFLFVTLCLTLLLATPGLADDPGFALSFDGENDLVVLDETSQIMGPGWEDEKTISLWVKPTGDATCTHPSPASCDNIFGDRARWWGISRGVVGGLDRIWVWNWDGNEDYVGIEYTVNEWIHIALVHEAGELRAYKFGVEAASTPSGATMQPNTGAQPVLYIGGIIRGGDYWNFSGEIDEVRLWNYARTSQQLTDDMLVHLNGDEPGLMAYYKMSDGSGETLSDDSGNGWDGILGGNNPYDASGVPQWVTSGAFIDPPPTSTPTATSTATNTPTPTNTSTPTNTPTPTVTGTPPTPTPTVTGTPPTPTATVTGTPPTPTATVTGTPPTPTATSEPAPLDEFSYLPIFITGE